MGRETNIIILPTEGTSEGSTTVEDASELLTIDEAAERLRCSKSHIYRLISSGSLGHVDISIPGSGKPKTRIRLRDLASFIQSSTA